MSVVDGMLFPIRQDALPSSRNSVRTHVLSPSTFMRIHDALFRHAFFHSNNETVHTMSSKTIIRPPDTGERPRRVSLSDRIALRIGLALIIWSRRTRRERPVIDHETFLAERRARAAREDAWLAAAIQLRSWR